MYIIDFFNDFNNFYRKDHFLCRSFNSTRTFVAIKRPSMM